MIEGIEALIALERTGTISEAAAHLRLTQSAVSKRIQALENDLKYRLIEPEGRRVKLTQQGILFLSKAKPLIAELKSLKQLDSGGDIKRFSIALSDSIAASWGPRLIRLASKKIKNVEFEIHVHRSTLVEENVKLGRYHLGLCISPTPTSQLVSTFIAEEPMVLITSKFENIGENQKLITIEKTSGTWKSTEEKIFRNPKLKHLDLIHVESFAAIIQMVKEGFGIGVVPIGIAQAMQVPKKDLQHFNPSIERPIRLISHKNIHQLSAIEEFKKNLTLLNTEMW